MMLNEASGAYELRFLMRAFRDVLFETSFQLCLVIRGFLSCAFDT